MSTRNDILDDLTTTLGNISIPNGYNTSPSTIIRAMKPFNIFHSFPVLMVLGGTEEFEDVMGGEAVSYLTVRVQGYTRDKSAPETALCEAIADVCNALEDASINSHHEKMTITGVETDEGNFALEMDGVGFFRVSLEIIYEFTRGSM